MGDMRGVGEEYESVHDMVEKLGVVAAAEAFVNARKYFEANHDKEPEEERPMPMTAGEWKDLILGLEGEEEEDFFDDDEEEFLSGDDYEEDDLHFEDDLHLPPPKKVKKAR